MLVVRVATPLQEPRAIRCKLDAALEAFQSLLATSAHEHKVWKVVRRLKLKPNYGLISTCVCVRTIQTLCVTLECA